MTTLSLIPLERDSLSWLERAIANEDVFRNVLRQLKTHEH
jgi:hypothetical protein